LFNLSSQAYLDNSATTPVCDSAIEAINRSIRDCWGNPSSLHNIGTVAFSEQKKAREILADRLSCQTSEIYFTAGGTDGNNIALYGAARRNSGKGKRIVTTEIEHPSVREVFKKLEAEGYDVVYLGVGKDGKISIQDLIKAVTKDTCLVSIMHVNNEVGSIQPIEAVRAAVTRAGSRALIHCDAVQSFGKIVTRPLSMGVDMMTVSSHKIHGPKGAGALYIKRGTNLAPHIVGGGQENGIRPGTEPMPAIMGFSAAVSSLPNIQKQLAETAAIRDYMVFRLRQTDGVVINSPDDACPYITNFSVLGVPSQTMVSFLSEHGVYVSGGSACAKGHRSHVLTAMGLAPEVIDSAIRVSLSRFNTKLHIDMLIEGIKLAKDRISRV